MVVRVGCTPGLAPIPFGMIYEWMSDQFLLTLESTPRCILFPRR